MSNTWNQLPTIPRLPEIPSLPGSRPIPTLPTLPTLPSMPASTAPKIGAGVSAGVPVNSSAQAAPSSAISSLQGFSSSISPANSGLGLPAMPGLPSFPATSSIGSLRPAPVIPQLPSFPPQSPASNVNSASGRAPVVMPASTAQTLPAPTSQPVHQQPLSLQPQTQPLQQTLQQPLQQSSQQPMQPQQLQQSQPLQLRGSNIQGFSSLTNPTPQSQPLSISSGRQDWGVGTNPSSQPSTSQNLDLGQELPGLTDLDLSFGGTEGFGDLNNFGLDLDSDVQRQPSQVQVPSSVPAKNQVPQSLGRLSTVAPIQVPSRYNMSGDAFPEPDGSSSPSASLAGLDQGYSAHMPPMPSQPQHIQQPQPSQSQGSGFMAAAMRLVGAATGSSQVSGSSAQQTPTPSANYGMPGTNAGGIEENEPPLLEELGIDIPLIIAKTRQIVFPQGMFKLPFRKQTSPEETNASLVDDPNDPMASDLAGPLVFCLVLGVLLLFTGKVHFGYIYGFGVTGCVLMYVILNLLSHSQKSVSLDRTIHIFGYCLPPVLILSFISIFIGLRGPVGHVLSALMIAWSTCIATGYIERILDMRQQRYLVAYPVALFYTCFAMLAVF